VRVVGLRSQLAPGLIALGETPRLSWQISDESYRLDQQAYEIQASHTRSFETVFASTGAIEGVSRIAIPAPGDPPRSRETRFYRVRVTTAAGPSPWSDPLEVETGLLHASDWHGQAITLAGDAGRERAGPAPMLRKEFDLDGEPVRARLYVTSLGLNFVRLNGRPSSDALLSPGWTSYRKRLVADTHDVTGHLAPGRNAIGAVLGDGWYRGRLGWTPGQDRCRYGSELGLLLQLEVELDGGQRIEICSDPTWVAATGEIRAADLYDGALLDLSAAHPGWDRPGYDDGSWTPVVPVPLDLSSIEGRLAPPVRAIEVRAAEVSITPTTSTRIDAGQNLAGFVRLRVRGRSGERVAVHHAEVREPDGSLHTRALRSARAVDEYTLADDGETTLEPTFTFHGFRHADVDTSASVVGADVVAISSDLRSRSSFRCSDERINRLHENVVWSLRGNFVSLPTDCPQRDERLGWTGDAQAFAATACTLVESDSFWDGWLRDLALDQDDVLGVPSVVPDVVLEGEARFGRAGWADAATIVPWAVYESYGDIEILHRQFPSMRKWVESLMRRRGPDGLLAPSWQFGDWLDPDAPPDRPWEAKCDPEFIANSYFSWSSRLTADAADVIGEPAVSAAFRALADRVAAATWSRWAPGILDTQTGCAIALQLGIAPPGERESVGDALAELVDAADGRVATGFLGTPLVLPALAAAGRFDSAFRMLLRTDAPSWLYQVSSGATTVWERWDAIRPDGTIHPGTMASPTGDGPSGHMLSFNHYAYGAVIDWVYRHVAGLAPDRDRPGYAHVIFAPRPVVAIDAAQATVEAPYGTVSIAWRLEGNRMVADVALPMGTTGSFRAPAATATSMTVDGQTVDAQRVATLPAGMHRLIIDRPAIAADDRSSFEPDPTPASGS
jgi:alpha-L-rhamnosidase